ncbi:MAG TPA: carbamoyltransferase HypF [Anaerolineae bacterium]|nr:carbamoyltransferase HypF [Anaerolineae bacterium]
MGVIARRIHVNGIVQGVGYRPFVYRLAHELDVTGWVRNSSTGVDIEVEGEAEAVMAFVEALTAQAPPLARVQRVDVHPISPNGFREFTIRYSHSQAGFTLVSPDVATCPDCLRELFDPTDRRYRYPFINCTNCGPRFTIIQALPYDRPNTTMRVFPMCAECQAEYDDPLNRRFHAQPNACPACGPEVTLEIGQWKQGVEPQTGDLEATAALLRAGAIVAVKGLGGFHLACDATNPEAVAELRRRKTRPHKPLAVMMRDLAQVRAHCYLTPKEETLITSPAAPIVLLERRPDSALASGIAPGNRTVGVMLPYTPLHHLLLHDVNRPLVMTSGNRADEPIARTNEQAREKLGHIADAFLFHNREIHNRADDSVWMVAPGGSVPLRRSRGYAPYPVRLAFSVPKSVLAVGGQLKNTFCLLAGDQAFLSQHIGEMDNLETLIFFQEAVSRYVALFGIEPQVIAHDLHPDYLITRLAQEEMGEKPRVAVQHHHAHVAACLAENGQAGPVIGLAFDGTGYGTDGAIWGGEFLIADLSGFRRAAHLAYFPLPGGEAAIHRPYRTALGLMQWALGYVPDLPALAQVSEAEQRVVIQQVARDLNAPPTSSCGRLFDAVAALIGLREETSYEAQAAIELEMIAANENLPGYPYRLAEVGDIWLIQPDETLAALVNDVQRDVPIPVIARRFHQTVADFSLDVVQKLRDQTGLNAVALSGGCFQNRLLLRLLLPALEAAGFTVYTHHQVPANDGGLSLGQAAVAGWKMIGGS